MPDLPLIQLDEPVVVPAVPARTYPLLWLLGLQAGSIPADIGPGAGTIEIVICPMAADGTGDILPELREVIRTDEMWLAISEVPELATAIGANLTAAMALKTWIAARRAALAANPSS